MNSTRKAPNKALYHITILVIATALLLAASPLSFIALAGVLFSIYILNSLLLAFGEGVPINLVIVFMACMQWIVGPVLSYYTGINHPFYGMQVPEEVYFTFALPGVIFFHLGLLVPIGGVNNNFKKIINTIGPDVTSKSRGAYYLIAIGFLASFAMPLAPASLFFFLYLLSQLKFVGCFYLYLSESKSNTILYIVFATLLINAMVSALFHDLLLWSFFFLFIYCIKNSVSLTRKLVVFFIGFFLVFVLQSVKYQYRNIAWASTTMDSYGKSEVFLGMIVERIFSPDVLFDPKANELTITRLNQGWIITRVMNYVPSIRPFAGGETISTAFSNTLLPRFLVADKAVTAGGKEKMERFTGIILQSGTSMNISLLGEGYANYGQEGGVIFMFLIGIAFSLVLRFLLLKSITNPTLIFWIPFLYLQVVKAETDLATTLNYLVKATIVMITIFYIFRKVLKVEI